MDGTEAQLKFGAYLTNYTDPNHPLHPLNLSAQASTSQTPAPATSSSVSGVNVMGKSKMSILLVFFLFRTILFLKDPIHDETSSPTVCP